MKYSQSSHTICLGDNRQAALYFDRVLPLDTSEIYSIDPATEFTFLSPRGEKILRSLLSSPDETIPTEKLNEIFCSTSELLCWAAKIENPTHHNSQLCTALIRAYANNASFQSEEQLESALGSCVCNPFVGQPVRSTVAKIANAAGLNNPSIILQSNYLADEIGTDEDVSLTLSNIPLVDANKASWEQIIEFRKNKDARANLRNLRLFLHTNYDGRNRAFIEDDVAKRMDDYNKTCKDFGFETTTSVLSSITNSKNLRLVGIASLTALILGVPSAASLAAITGGSIEIGNLCIELAKKKYNYNRFKRDHELAYIIKARRELKSAR